MKCKDFSRREFLQTSSGLATGVAAGSLVSSLGCAPQIQTPVVSIARIENDNIGYAVEKAIDLLGGIETVAKDQERIMLKPNLVDSNPDDTTKPEVIMALGRLMKNAGKEVLIGEGSGVAPQFNLKGGEAFRTRNKDILDPMQQFVFDELGFTDLAKSLKVPLINLHSGPMAEVNVQNGYVFDKVTLHESLTDIDLLCSVPMMKTHIMATVTLGMKNLIGVYPGTVYYSVRSWLHDYAEDAGSVGIAGEIVDMVRANKMGLTVVDGSVAMEGQGPSGGDLVKMDVIIAGTTPLATDMVTASIMGFEINEIPTFTWAHKAGMIPTTLEEIEIRGEQPQNVKRNFVKPNVITWESIRNTWGVKEI
ncbi:DUF362 domain-containing protein [Candidatus Latescibacterota bacterium]